MARDTLIGRQLDEYRLDVLLGQGGMARVYRGLDVRLKRWVAIKVIDAPFRADSDYVMRFEREAQAIGQLEHPHIVRLYRYGEVKGLLYMAMQYIEGAALDQVLATYREDGEFIEPDEANRIVREVCLALDYAHSKGVIHRDVKPSNIILNRQGQAILTDFGLALLTEVGTRGEIFGTPHYMAPEQAVSSARAVSQSDFYAMGVILYEMFTGELPFDAPQPLEVAMLHMTEPPPPPRQLRPDLSPKLEAVILKTLAKEPKDRYPSGATLAHALSKALQSAASKASLPSPTTRSIPERVAVSLAKRPLPPLPAAVLDVAPKAAKPIKADKAGGAAEIKSAPPPTQVAPAPAAPTRQRSLLYLGIGIGLVMSLSLVAVVLVVLFLWSRDGGGVVAGQPAPVVEASAPLENVPTTISAESSVAPPAALVENPIPTDTPTTPPTATALPAPQLLADTSRDFSAEQKGGAWEYLWSQPNETKFRSLRFDEQRQYGACWYAEDYIRICPESGHPGNGADIAWRWTSPVSGRVQVLLSAHKIDTGGDGVTILAYHNQLDRAIQGRQIGPSDTVGVFQENFFETDIKEGDILLFVMKRNGDARSDHTAFQVQIYLTGAEP